MVSGGTTVLAQQQTDTVIRAIEYAWPRTPGQWLLYGGAFVAVAILTLWLYRRDTRALHPAWAVWLMALRLGVIAGLVVIALNPQERTQKSAFRPSRVAVLVDRSLSMQFPAIDADTGPEDTPTRADAVRELLAQSELLPRLQADHQVSLFAFDSAVTETPFAVLPSRDPRNASAEPERPRDAGRAPKPDAPSGSNQTTPEAASETAGTTATAPARQLGDIDLDEFVRPVGLETRLGESLLEVLRRLGGKTFSGIVVVSDGASNAGIDPTAAAAAARAARVRICTVGVGGTAPPKNVRIASIQSPTDVYLRDAFDMTVFVQAEGLSGRTVEVELLRRPKGETAEPALVEKRVVQLLEDGVPREVHFEQQPESPGTFEYLVRVHSPAGVRELSLDDNQRTRTIRITDRKTKVLLIAGGPMREFRFARNILYRHQSIETHLWLQSAPAGQPVSQECDKLLFAFPESREELFQYDCLVCFDVDWRLLSTEQVKLLTEWVFSHAGGLILFAGDVFTPQLASASDERKQLQQLYPVVLNTILFDLEAAPESRTPWPPEFTPAGREAGFLQLKDDPLGSQKIWADFPGFYRCYPTAGTKAGTTVYALFPDPRAATPPVLMASQFYGAGRVLYFGTTEFWRLRALDEAYHERFWTNVVREAAQGRLTRGSTRGTLFLERQQYFLGQTVRVRAQLLDAQYQGLQQPTVPMDVYGPDGRPILPPPVLRFEKTRPGQYAGDFRAGRAGTYRIQVRIPDTDEVIEQTVDVLLPNLEAEQPRQNVQLLRMLAAETGGVYATPQEASTLIPPRLPNLGQMFTIDERLRTLWDRSWVLGLLVGLLSAEWLTRKLLKLA